VTTSQSMKSRSSAGFQSFETLTALDRGRTYVSVCRDGNIRQVLPGVSPISAESSCLVGERGASVVHLRVKQPKERPICTNPDAHLGANTEPYTNS